MIRKQYFCPKCGKKLKTYFVPNKENAYYHEDHSCYKGSGDAYDKETGEQLFSVISECPTQYKKSIKFINRKNMSHYIIRIETDITFNKANKKYN